MNLKANKLLGRFTKRNCKKTNKKEIRVEKVIKRKGDKLYVKWKDYEYSFNSCVDKINIVQMSEYLPKPKSLGANMKAELDLSNYATKADLKNATGVNTSKFVKQVDLASL